MQFTDLTTTLGSHTNNIIVWGTRSNFRIPGTDDNDTIDGGGGNDFIDGGAGIDTAVFFGNSRDFTVTDLSGVVQVTGLDSAPKNYRGKTAELVNVEKVQFLDKSFPRDVPSGTADDNSTNTAPKPDKTISPTNAETGTIDANPDGIVSSPLAKWRAEKRKSSESAESKLPVTDGDNSTNSGLETTKDNILVAALNLSARAYSDNHHNSQLVVDDINSKIQEWKPLEATDLGFSSNSSRFSKVGSEVGGDLLRYDYFHASATVGLTMLDGKRTLGISFEGTNVSLSANALLDIISDVSYIKGYYGLLKDSNFIPSILDYINANNIERVLVTGHSLGGATAQSFMHDYGQDDARFIGVTFGSPGTNLSHSVPEERLEERLVNIQHNDDPVVALGNARLYFDNGSIVKVVAEDSGHGLVNYSETVKFLASKLDAKLLFRDLTIGTDDSDSMTGGLPGNEIFIGFGGNDSIDGGLGVDTAIYTGPKSSYILDKEDKDFSLSDQRAGSNNDGTDTLDSIERIIFTDSALALDVDGSAGKVAKLIGAVFGAGSVSNTNYVAFGLSELDKGTSYEDLAALAIDAAGANSSEQVASLLWNNVVGAAPTADQAQSYIGDLNSGKYTAGALGVLAAETTLNESKIDLVGLSDTGIIFDPLYYQSIG